MSTKPRKPNPAARRPSAAQQRTAQQRRTLLIAVTGVVALVIVGGVIALVLALRGGGGMAVAGAPVDGVQCAPAEGQTQHVHQHLDIAVDGKFLPVPANVGILSTKGCLYWIHTHSPDGVLHVEAPVSDHLTLGTFFDIWAVSSVDRTALDRVRAGPPDRVIVDGKPYTGDYRAIPLLSHGLITLEYGKEMPQSPFDFIAAGLPT